MNLRLGVFTGLAVGYVLGTKAGRERYDQLRDLGRRVAGSDAGQQLQAEAREAKERAGAAIGGKTNDGAGNVSELNYRDDQASPGTTPPAL